MTDQPTPQPEPRAPELSEPPPEAGAKRNPFGRRFLFGFALFAIAFAGLALPSWDRVLEPSAHFHFADLAESFMQGRLDTDTPSRRRGAKPRPDDPPGYQEAIDRHLTNSEGNAIGPNDWATFRILTLNGGETVQGVFPWKDDNNAKKTHFHTLDGLEMVIDVTRDVKRACGKSGRQRCDEKKHHVSFPPFPAIVAMPFVAIWHYDFNDVVFTLGAGALNFVLLFFLLEALRARGWSSRPRRENLWLAVLFTFGTVHYFSAVRGEVWFTALILGVTIHLAYVWAALDARRPLLAGLFLGLGMATRTPIAFAVVFFAVQLLFPGGRWGNWSFGEKVKRGALFALPVLAVGITLMFYNNARFGSPFEFGHTFLMEGTRASIRDHGLFSSWFLNNNLKAALVNLPRIDGNAPFIHLSRHGLSLIATTPFFLYLLWPRRDGWSKENHFRHLALWLTVAAVAIPALLYQNTGWAQFGYRFSLDWSPYWMVLLAMSRRPLSGKAKVLIGVCIAINLFGAITFGRMGAFYYD